MLINSKNLTTMIEISDSCPEEKYRPADQTECISCDLGKQPNSDKTLCGEYSYRSYHLRKKQELRPLSLCQASA